MRLCDNQSNWLSLIKQLNINNYATQTELFNTRVKVFSNLAVP